MARIRVTNNQTGQTGTIPEENFDVSKYSKIAGSSATQQPATTSSTPQEPQKKKRLLGGALPVIGGIGGGIVGSLPTGGIPSPLSVAGAVGGTGAGYATENLLEDFLGRQQETPMQQLQTAGTQTALSGAGEAIMGPLMKLGGKLLGPIGKLFGDKLPKLLAKTALPEGGKAATTAVKRSIKGVGKELQEDIVDKGIMGTAKKIAKNARDQLGTEIPNSVENKVQAAIKKIPIISTGKEIIEQGKIMTDDIVGAARGGAQEAFTNVEKFLYDSLEQAGVKVAKQGGATKLSQLSKIKKEVADIWQLQIMKIKKEGWEAILQLRRDADKLAKGIAARDKASISGKVNAEVANTIREKFASDPDLLQYAPELKQLMEEENFFIRLYEAASKKAGQPFITRGDIIPLIIGGGVGGVTGGMPGAMAGVAAAKAPFTTSIGTTAAQGLKKGTQIAGQGITQGSRSVMQMLAPYITNLLSRSEEK